MSVEDYAAVFTDGLSKKDALVRLVKEMRAYMQEGWQPLGSPFYCGSVTTRGTTLQEFAQVIVKEPTG